MTRTERLAYQQFVTLVTGWHGEAREKEIDRTLADVERSFYHGTRSTCNRVLKQLALLWPDLDDEPPDL